MPFLQALGSKGLKNLNVGWTLRWLVPFFSQCVACICLFQFSMFQFSMLCFFKGLVSKSTGLRCRLCDLRSGDNFIEEIPVELGQCQSQTQALSAAALQGFNSLSQTLPCCLTVVLLVSAWVFSVTHLCAGFDNSCRCAYCSGCIAINVHTCSFSTFLS